MSAFLFGFCFDVVYLFWLYCADRGRPLRCALASMLVGYVSLKGIAEGLKGRGRTALLILGYGAGAYCVALWRSRS